MNPLYTIGHSTHSVEIFIKLLNQHNINYIVDVRSVPYSQYADMYNKENIKTELNRHGISYAFMGKYFGARPADKSLYTDGYLDFEKVTNSEIFNIGLRNVQIGMEDNNIALMCTEKRPIECHRTILVANAFYNVGCTVRHILDSGDIQTHEEINEELLNLYFPDRNQISMFDHRTPEEYLRDSYKLQNKVIGYRIDKS